MAGFDANLFNRSPYHDDFDARKGFLRVLFRKEFPVQARELTQLQTIMSNQIERFGKHVFEDGSKVLDGNVSESTLDFIRLDPTFATQTVDFAAMIGFDVQLDGNPAIRAKVIHAESGQGTNDPYPILYIEYTSGAGVFTDGDTVTSLNPGQFVQATLKTASTVATTGQAKVFSIDRGVWFLDGCFVLAEAQSIAMSRISVTNEPNPGDLDEVRLFNQVTSLVGYTVAREIITDKDDPTLRDPAFGTTAFNAPGADRFRINLTITKRNFVFVAEDDPDASAKVSDTDFFEIIRMINDQVQKVQNIPDYAVLEDTLARRTFDESGNYTVRDFPIDIREHLKTLTTFNTVTRTMAPATPIFQIGETVTGVSSGFTGIVATDDAATQVTVVNMTAVNTVFTIGETLQGVTSGATGTITAVTTETEDDLGVFTAATGGVETKVAVGLEPGKALIFGQEFQTQNVEFVPVDKARDIQEVRGLNINPLLGNYVKVNTATGFGSWATFDLDAMETVSLVAIDKDTPVNKIVVGTAQARQLVFESATISRLYIFNLDITATFAAAGGGVYNINDVLEINLQGSPPPSAPLFVLSATGVFDTARHVSLFHVPLGDTVSDFIGANYRIQQQFNLTFNSPGGIASTSSGDPNVRFVEPSGIPAADQLHYTIILTSAGDEGTIVDLSTVVLTTNNTSAPTAAGQVNVDSSGTLAGKTGVLVASLDVNDSTVAGFPVLRRNKVLTENVVVAGLTLDGNNQASLLVSDVLSISKILDTASGADVTSNFILDDGQRDNFYDHGAITLKPAFVGAVTGPFNITLSYFTNSGIGPFFVNSYTNPSSNIEYSQIPNYQFDGTGEIVSLRDVVDFRPVRNPDASFTSNPGDGLLSGAWFPKVGETLEADYHFYLPRIDKVVVTRDRRFKILKGIPSLNPAVPPDDSDAMTIYVLTLQPFTHNTRDVEIRFVDNKRFTMRDIGSIAQRVEQLEYYTALTLLEKETESLKILDGGGLDRFKSGILVDAFGGHSIGDVENVDYNCSIDFAEGQLRPPFLMDNIDFDEVALTRQNLTVSTDNLVMLDFELNTAIDQPLATAAISINPFNVVNWMGNLRISPSSDNWVDTDQRPDVRVNFEGENDAWEAIGNAIENLNDIDGMANGFGTQWNDWQTTWTGEQIVKQGRARRRVSNKQFLGRGKRALAKVPVAEQRDIRGRGRILRSATETIKRRDTVDVTQNQTRTGIRTRLVPENLSRSIGNRIVNVSIVPFMRSRLLTIQADCTKPNTVLLPFFDGIDVSQYMTFNGVPVTTSAPIVSDNSGCVRNLVFTIPPGVFKTGERLFRLTDEPGNKAELSTTSAEASYQAQGVLQTQENTIVSTRVPMLRRDAVNDERIVRDTITRETVQTNNFRQWVDPLAQTFLVNSTLFPNGFFVPSIDVYFRNKDANIPVTLQIRPTVNGFPHSSLIVPLAEKTLMSDDVFAPDATSKNTHPTPGVPNIVGLSNLGGTATRFEFSSPVYLPPGEYAIVLLSNSNLYETFIAEIGTSRLGTGERVSQQPYAGVLFKSQNGSTWSPDQTQDLMFRIHRCEFNTSTSGSVVFGNQPVPVGSVEPVSILNAGMVQSTHLNFQPTSLIFEVDTSDAIANTLDGTFDEILPNENVFFQTPQRINMDETIDSFQTRITFTSTDSHVSPVLDLERLSWITVSNRVNANTDTNISSPTYNGELEPQAFLPSSGGAIARYISRRVNLEPGFEATDMKVLLTLIKEAGTDVHVFIKTLSPDSEEIFDDQRYVQLQPQIVTTSDNAEDFREISYVPDPGAIAVAYGSFAIKIVMYSGNTSVVPLITDLRAIALA